VIAVDGDCFQTETGQLACGDTLLPPLLLLLLLPECCTQQLLPPRRLWQLMQLTFSGSMPAAMYVAAMLRVAVLSSTGSWGAVIA